LQNIQNGFGSALTFFIGLLDKFGFNLMVKSMLNHLQNKTYKSLKIWYCLLRPLCEKYDRCVFYRTVLRPLCEERVGETTV
jgi:hypothetical protein